MFKMILLLAVLIPQPGDLLPIKVLRLRPDAPKEVKDWFAALPEYKDDAIRRRFATIKYQQAQIQQINETGEHKDMLKSCQEDIERMRREIHNISYDYTFLYIPPNMRKFEVEKWIDEVETDTPPPLPDLKRLEAEANRKATTKITYRVKSINGRPVTAPSK